MLLIVLDLISLHQPQARCLLSFKNRKHPQTKKLVISTLLSSINIPYGQSSAKPSVTWSLGKSVTWSLGHLVTDGHTHGRTNNIRIYKSADNKRKHWSLFFHLETNYNKPPFIMQRPFTHCLPIPHSTLLVQPK